MASYSSSIPGNQAKILFLAPEQLDRVEVRWNDRLVGTLFEPPYRHRIQVSAEAPIGTI